MICFNVGQKHLYSKDSIKSILNKSDFRELFSKVKNDLFKDYKSTNEEDLRQYLSELFNLFNVNLSDIITEEYKKDASINKEDVYPFGYMDIPDIREYLDSLKQISSDPPLEEPVDGDELSYPVDQHLDEKDVAQRDNQFANFYTRIGDVLYPATIGNRVALVKPVRLEDGTEGYMVAAVLSENEVKQYGIPFVEGPEYSGTVNKFFANGLTDSFGKVPSSIAVESNYNIKVDTNNPFTVKKSVRNRVLYSPEITFDSKAGLSLSNFNQLKKLAEQDFATSFPGLTIVSSVLQINTGLKDDVSGFSVNTLGKPILKVIARDSNGNIVNKQIGVELKPRPVSLDDSLVINADTFKRALDTLESLGVSNQMVLSYANILSSFWTIQDGQIVKTKDEYPQEILDQLNALNTNLPITQEIINNLEDIITTYYGPVDGLFIAENLNDFYKEYAPSNTTLASEKAIIKSMFEKFNGFQLDDAVVNQIFNTSDLRSGNVILNILKPVLGHNINNPLSNKEPNPKSPIVINGVNTTYEEVRDLYREARKKVVVIDKGENNEKYVLQYEGQKIQIEKSFGKGKKVNVRVFPNMNSVGRTMGNLQNITDIEKDENGKPILQTKPRLRAGGGPLVKELGRLFDSNKGIDQLSNREALPGVEDLYVANSDGKSVRMKPLLNNVQTLRQTYLNRQAYDLRLMINKLSYDILDGLGNSKDALKEFEKFFVKTRSGDYKLFRDVDLNSIETRNGLMDFLEGVLDSNQFDAIQEFIKKDDAFIEEEMKVDPPIKQVLDAITDRNNYDEDGYWIRSTTKIGSDYKGHYLRRNLSQFDSANDFTVNSYGRIEYKDSPDGFRYLPIAYAYLQDPKFREFYNTEKERVSEFGLPDITVIERYIKDNGEQNIIDSFENKILPQLTTNYNGTQAGSLAVTQGRQQATPTPQQAPTAPASDTEQQGDEFDNNDESVDFSTEVVNDFEVELDAARAYFKRQFPFANDKVLNFISKQAFNERFNTTGKAGAYTKGLIYIVSEGKAGMQVLRHEIFHKIFNEYLTEDERFELYNAFKNKYFPNSTVVDMKEFEEMLAIKYQDYERTGNETGIIQRIFNMILRLFNFIRVNTNSVEDFFEQIEAGKFVVVKTKIQDGVRYMSDPINKMGGIENYDRAIKEIKKDFYTLLVKGVDAGGYSTGIKYYSTLDVKNRILAKVNSKIEKATDETERMFYEAMKKNLVDLIENAFSFVNSLDVKEKKKEQKEDKENNDETANLKDHIDDKENQNELANSPERVRFWLSNIARPSKKGATATGTEFIGMGAAFAKLVELTSRLDFNGQVPFEKQLDRIVNTLKSDTDYKLIADALKELISTTITDNVSTKNVFFFNPLSAITVDESLNVDLNKINLFDPVQLKLTKLSDGQTTFEYTYFEDGEKKTLTGFYHSKGERSPVELLNEVGKKLKKDLNTSTPNLKDDIGKLYNASVTQSILKDITKVISSNRERNLITLVKSSYQTFGSLKVNFDVQVANNRQFALMQEIKTNFIEALDNTELRKAFFTGKPYVGPTIELPEGVDPDAIDDQRGSKEAIVRSDIEAITKVATKAATTDSEKSDAKTALQKVNSFLSLGLSFNNLSAEDIKNYSELLTEMLELKSWGKDVLFDKIDKEEDIPIYKGTFSDLDNESADSSEDQDQEQDDSDIIDTQKERIGAYKYVSDFNNQFFNLSGLSMKGSNREPNLSERSRDGKSTNYRFIRKSYIFDVLNRLIFNTQSNAGIEINDLNNSFTFLKSAWAKLNPFLNGISKIYQTMLEEGTATTSFANKEYFKKHSLESPSELFEKELLYFAYYTKINKGGLTTYFQQLPQQGDSTAHNAVEIDINSSVKIKGKLKAILTQFVDRPTNEQLKEEYGYVPKGYNRNNLVDFEVLGRAIQNAKLEGVTVSVTKKNSYIIEGLDTINDEIVDKIYESYYNIARQEAENSLKVMTKNPNFKLPNDFFSGLLKDKTLIEILSTFTNRSTSELTKLIKQVHEDTKNASDNHVRYKEKKTIDVYNNPKVKALLQDIITAQILNHGPNIFLIDQLTKGPSEFFGSPDAALKRRDSAGSPKEHLSVQTFDKDGKIIPGTERFARPNYKAVVVNDLKIVSDNREAFEKIVETFKSKYNIQEGQDLENIASNLLYNVQNREQLAKDLLGKEEISTEEMNDIVDLAYSYLNNTLSSRQLLRSFNLTAEDLQELDEEYGSDYEPTDGQGLHTTLRNAEIRANAGSNAEVDDILKPLHYEVLGKFGVPTMIKYSSVHLSEGFVENKPVMQKIKQVLERRGIDELVFASTVKVGAPSELISLQELLDDTNDDKINASTLTLSNNAYGLQLNPESRATKVSLFSQLLYFPKVTITDAAQVSRINTALAETMKSRSMAFDLNLYTKSGFVSRQMFQNTVKGALDPKASNNSEVVFDIFNALIKAGIDAYNHPGLMLTTERAFLGKAHDETIKTKFAGKKAVLVSSIATNNFGLKGFSASEEAQINANNLRTYQRTINGKKVLSSECFLPRGKYDADGKWTGILTEEQQNLIDEAIRNNQPIPEFFLANYSKNNFFGLRIPTTGIHSAVPLQVKGFYDSDSDINGIIVPPDIVQRHGSDFDVDSLFVVSRATFGKDYKITVTSDTISDELRDQIADVKLDNKEDQKELNSIIKEIESIKEDAAKDRRLATPEEVEQFNTQFENSEWDYNQKDKRGDKYNRELSLAGFMVKFYPNYRYVLSEEGGANGYFVYIGEIAQRKKQLIKLLQNLISRSQSNKEQLSELINQLKKDGSSVVTFNANDYIGYTRVGDGFKFDTHFNESNPSAITSNFLSKLDSMIPFVNVADRKKLLEIRAKYFQNVMVEEFLNITESEENIHMMVTTIYMEKYKQWIKNNTNNPVVPDISTPASASKQRSIATAGRIGTGISAIGIKMLSYLSGYTVKDDAAITINRNGNQVTLNTIFNRSEEENRSTLKELDALVNLNIDNIKELGLYPLNLNENTEGLYIAMRMLGLSFEEANSIMIQPIVKYIAEQPGYTPRNIANLAKGVQLPMLVIDEILNKKVDTRERDIESLLKDDQQLAVLGVIKSALELNNDIRSINKIADSIRVRRNTKAEIDNIKSLVNKLKNDSFILNMTSFLDDNEHIKQSLDISFKNLKVLEQKSINHSVKHNEILNSATNVNIIKKDNDAIRDSELKRKELVKFFASGFVRSKNYPSIKVGTKVLSGNDLFMELMYKRHLALQKFARKTEGLKENDFIFNVVSKGASTNIISVEGKNLKDDSAAEYKMKVGFSDLSNIKEVMYFKDLSGNEIRVESLEELKNLNTFEINDAGEVSSYQYLRTAFEYTPNEPSAKLSEIQKDYFDYEVLKSGLEFSNTSMAIAFTNEQHIEFVKMYNEVMSLFTQEGDLTTVREITKLFDTEFTLNNRNGVNLSPYASPIPSKTGDNSYVTDNGFKMKAYSGFDPAVGYYDLKLPAEKFDTAAFSNKALPRVIVFKRKLYMYTGSKSEEGNNNFNFYTEVGFDRKFGTYNFNSSMISNIGFLYLKQGLFDSENVDMSAEALSEFATSRGIDIHKIQNNGKSIMDLLSENNNNSLFKASTYIVSNFYIDLLNNIGIPQDEQDIVDEGLLNQMKIIAKNLQISDAIIDNSSAIGLKDVIVNTLQDINLDKPSRSPLSTETGVPRLKVRSLSSSNARFAYDYKMEYAFENTSFDTVDSQGNKAKGIIAVISEYTDVMNYNSKLVKLVMREDSLDKTKYSAIVDVIEPTQQELNDHYNSRNTYIYLLKEEASFDHLKLNDVLTDDMLSSPENPLNCKR